jgi:hypothetical protein
MNSNSFYWKSVTLIKYHFRHSPSTLTTDITSTLTTIQMQLPQYKLYILKFHDSNENKRSLTCLRFFPSLNVIKTLHAGLKAPRR